MLTHERNTDSTWFESIYSMSSGMDKVHHIICLLKTESFHNANFVVNEDKVGIMETLGFQCLQCTAKTFAHGSDFVLFWYWSVAPIRSWLLHTYDCRMISEVTQNNMGAFSIRIHIKSCEYKVNKMNNTPVWMFHGIYYGCFVLNQKHFSISLLNGDLELKIRYDQFLWWTQWGVCVPQRDVDWCKNINLKVWWSKIKPHCWVNWFHI